MTLRNELRFWWLWIAYRFKTTFSRCEWCGDLGAHPCSRMNCVVLCEVCAIMFVRLQDKIDEHAKLERRKHGEKATETLRGIDEDDYVW
jgi:hypothetical protein